MKPIKLILLTGMLVGILISDAVLIEREFGVEVDQSAFKLI
jgi:hypothetical protein